MKISLPSLFLAAVMTSVCISSVASETVYRWYDSNGTPHFSKKPPQNVEYETITTTTVNTVDRGQPSREEVNEKRTGETQDNEKYPEQLSKLVKQQQESCRKARDNKKSLLNNHRIQMKDADGNLRTLSHEEKLEQLKRADEGIQEYCN